MCECIEYTDGDIYLCPVCAGLVRDAVGIASIKELDEDEHMIVRTALVSLNEHDVVKKMEKKKP